MKKYGILFFLSFLVSHAFAQNTYTSGKFQFLSYGKIPTWNGIAGDWKMASPVIHLYDWSIYKGHADFVSKGLHAGMTFKQFREKVKHFETREYIPFFLYDLRNSPAQIESVSYTWAVQVEDYQYDDTQDQMAKTVLRLMESISNYISDQTGQPSKGIIILASSETVKPNNSISGLLIKNGYPNKDISKFLGITGGNKVKVLNSGTGFGYLKYVKAGMEGQVELNFHDIVIYEKMPARVPLVSGIITLEPQTPLSHINLLAQNRGTINLYAAEIKYLPYAELFLDKLVKIQCSDKKILISPANKTEAEKYWASKSSLKVNIPIADKTIKEIIDLSCCKDTSRIKISVVGAKAANYSLIQNKFPKYVKNGYALPMADYFDVIDRCGAKKLIEKLQSATHLIGQNEILQQIRDSILNYTMDSMVIISLRRLMDEKFSGKKIRLRSSTNCEDIPEFNGAGLYLSAGVEANENNKKLKNKLLKIYASLWSPLAFEERQFYHINHSYAGMAILINEAFPGEYANGVVLTIPNKNDFSIRINSQFGDNLVTNPDNSKVSESILYQSSASNHYIEESQSNIHDIFLDKKNEVLLNQLKDVALQMHKLLLQKIPSNIRNEYGVDIEFKIISEQSGLKLIIKQARPIRNVVLPE